MFWTLRQLNLVRGVTATALTHSPEEIEHAKSMLLDTLARSDFNALQRDLKTTEDGYLGVTRIFWQPKEQNVWAILRGGPSKGMKVQVDDIHTYYVTAKKVSSLVAAYNATLSMDRVIYTAAGWDTKKHMWVMKARAVK